MYFPLFSFPIDFPLCEEESGKRKVWTDQEETRKINESKARRDGKGRKSDSEIEREDELLRKMSKSLRKNPLEAQTLFIPWTMTHQPSPFPIHTKLSFFPSFNCLNAFYQQSLHTESPIKTPAQKSTEFCSKHHMYSKHSDCSQNFWMTFNRSTKFSLLDINESPKRLSWIVWYKKTNLGAFMLVSLTFPFHL